MAILYTGLGATARIAGGNSDALVPYNMLAFENRRGSNRLVNIRRWIVQVDNNSILASTVAVPQVIAYRGSGDLVTQGSVKVPKGTFDTAQTSDPFVNFWHTSSPDGFDVGQLSGTPGSAIWRTLVSRQHTLANKFNTEDQGVLPVLVETNPVRLYPGEYLLVQILPTANQSDPQTTQWISNVCWTEETLSTFAISGVVTLSATPVVGAEVAIVVADDVAMTNAYLHSIQVTAAGGTWSANIPTGKLAFAYAQNDVAGTKYTSPGRPYQA